MKGEIEEADKLVEANTGVTQRSLNSDFYPDLVMPDNKPLGFTPLHIPKEEVAEVPSIEDTAGANFRLYNVPYRAGKALWDTLSNNPFKERTMREDGYDPIKEGLLDDIPEEYWYNVLRQSNREDAMVVKQNINQELEDKQTVSRSGAIANLTTTLGATFLDPTIAIPIAQIVKYASVSKGALQGMIRTGASMAPAIALQNAILTGTKETEDISDWAWNTMFESAVAAAIGGAVGAFTAKSAKNELKNMKAVFKAIEDDVDIRYKISESGEVLGAVAVAQEGSTVGAAQVKGVQDLLDAGEISFKDNGFVKKVFKLGSPAIQGLTDRFEVTRRLTSQLMSHPFETSLGNAHAIQDPSAFDFVKSWRHIHANAEIFTRAMWLESLGLEGIGKGIKAVSGTWTGKYQTLEEFREICGQAYRRNGEGASPSVKAVVDLYNKEIYKPLWEEMLKRYPEMEGHEFTNIVQYLNRAYHKGKIQERPDEFIKDVAAYITDVNKRVETRRQPINQAKESIAQTREALKGAKGVGSKEELAKLNRDLVDQTTTLRKLEDQLIDDVVNKRIDLDMLEGKIQITPEQVKQINAINAPMETLETNIKTLRQDLAKLRGDKTPEGLQSRKQIREKIKKSKEDLANAKNKLTDDIVEGRIPKDLLYKKSSGLVDIYELKNPKRIAKLRPVLDEFQIADAAESVRNNIMQLNEEQVLGQMFGSMSEGGNNVFKSRVLMWNDTWAEKWLVNDIDQLAGLFTDQVSKRLYLDDVLQKYGSSWQDGMEGIVKKITFERDSMESKILEKPLSPERTKELAKLKKDFDKSTKFVNDMYKMYMGNYVDNTTTAYRVTDGIKKFAVATLLGNVPIVQIPEFVSPLFRYTYSEYIHRGLVSTLKRMGHIASNYSDKGYIRGAFSDLGQGINVATGARTQALVGYGSQYQPKTLLERYVNNMANWSQNVSLANHIMDFQETIVSFASQSSLLRILEKYNSGEQLSKVEIAKLDRARLNPKQWADRILKQYGINKTEEGAFVANFHLWEDAEAARRFRIAIEKEVRQVIMKPGPMDVPFGLKDPMLSLMTQFTSYMFAATNNFTIPLLTSPDLTKLTGTFLMLGAGAIVDPVRQLAKGEEVDFSFQALANAAIYNGGITGWQTDTLMKANATLDLPPLRFLQSDRVKSKKALFGAGPGLGLADMTFNVLGATLSGEMNLADARRAMRLFVPFSGTWYARRPLDSMLKSFNLAKTRESARRRKEWE